MNLAHIPALPSSDFQGIVAVLVWTALCILGMAVIKRIQEQG
ncbi:MULTISPECIES: hypothetical protein [unclassified Caballeronia]|nr:MULTISPECIES: hypothetical protein [unclassified Caballeronia]